MTSSGVDQSFDKNFAKALTYSTSLVASSLDFSFSSSTVKGRIIDISTVSTPFSRLGLLRVNIGIRRLCCVDTFMILMVFFGFYTCENFVCYLQLNVMTLL